MRGRRCPVDHILSAGWLKKLRDDRKLLIRAAAQAQKAADYVLGKVATNV